MPCDFGDGFDQHQDAGSCTARSGLDAVNKVAASANLNEFADVRQTKYSDFLEIR